MCCRPRRIPVTEAAKVDLLARQQGQIFAICSEAAIETAPLMPVLPPPGPVASPQERFTVGSVTPLVIGATGAVFFGACAAGGCMAHQYLPALLLLLFVLPPAYISRLGGDITITPEGVIHRSLFGTFRLDWRSITGIEVGAADGTMVLHGEDKRLALAPLGMWSGRQRSQAQALFAKWVLDLGLTAYPSNAAAYKSSRNVRVRRRAGT